MENNTLDILGLQIVDYFINYENYEPFSIPKELAEQQKGTVYLLNKTSSNFQLIKIVKQNIFNSNIINNQDNIINYIKTNIFSNDEKFKELLIILNKDSHNEINHTPMVDIIISTPEKIVKDLQVYYPMISKKVKSSSNANAENESWDENNFENLSAREKKWKSINFQNRNFLKESNAKIKNNQLFYVWLMLVFPIAAFIFITIVSGNIGGLKEFLFDQGDINKLVFGALSHNLAFGALQLWRFITYPLATNSAATLIISLFLFSSIGSYVESFYGGKKALLIWVTSVILVGFLQSAVQQNVILAGFLPLTYISMGAMIPIIWNYKLFKSEISKRFYFITFLLFLFWAMSGFLYSVAVQFFISLTIGWCIGSIVSYHNRKLTYFYAFSPVAIGVLLLFGILTVVLNKYYNIDYNNQTNEVLNVYKEIGIIKQGYIDWVNNNFFHS